MYADAEQDAASKELDHVTWLDCTDDAAPETKRLSERFKVRGTPALIVFGPSGRTELRRFDMFIPPQTLAPALRWALRPEALEGAIEAAPPRAGAAGRHDPARVDRAPAQGASWTSAT